MTRKELCWLRLHLTPGLGRTAMIRLMEAFGSIEDILAAGPSAWIEQASIRPAVARRLPPEDDDQVERTGQALDQAAVRIVTLWDDHYPPLLRQIHDPPALLYVRGRLPDREALAVVGARKASRTGLRLTGEICTELASRGIAIISGLARGIDSAAHRGALDAPGPTVAVLGCGIDRVYPPENSGLFRQIESEGAILSEYPPGTAPLANHFPGRNRIISGLCRGVLIVEAAEESGSLITADFALEQGREVFAVPGAVYAATSRGVNRLLKDGAHLVTESRDILDVLWPQVPAREVKKQEDTFAAGLSEPARNLYGLLGHEGLHIDELALKSGLTPMEVSSILLHLELQGGVEQLPGMHFVRRRKP